MPKSNLILHCGASAVEREQLALVPTPPRTASWVPIPHDRLLTQVESALGGSNLEIVSEAHGLSHNGARYFGLLQIDKRESAVSEATDYHGHGFQLKTQSEYGYVVGLANSHDRKFTARFAVGGSVFVCDNLSFFGDVTMFRKHTRFIERDLPALVSSSIGKLVEKWGKQAERFDAYKQHELSHARAHDLLIKALDVRAISTRQIPEILKEWRAPRHPEFVECGLTAWRFFNCITEIEKESGIFSLPAKTQRLHGLLDQECGIFGQN